MIIYNEALYTVVVAIRVLFLVLFCGANILYIIGLNTGVDLLPPPQRLIAIRSIAKRFLLVSWMFIAVMTVSGLATIFLTSLKPNLGSLTSTSQGIILGSEAVVTLLIIISGVLNQVVLLPKASQAPIGTSESSDKSLKWLTLKNSQMTLNAVYDINLLCIINIILGIAAIVLGVIFSSL